MLFKEFVLLENVRIVYIDPEEDWEYADQAEQVAKAAKINISRVKEPTFVALNDNDDVIGAAFTSWSRDDDASDSTGEDVGLWDFDVAVHPDWQGYKQVGMKLIKAAEEERQERERMYDQNASTRLWVVNPKLARVLQHPKFGYEPEAEYPDGSAHLRKW